MTVTVPRNEYINRIISKWGVKSFQTTDYVFGMLGRNDFAEVIRNTAKAVHKGHKQMDEKNGKGAWI